MKQRWLIAGLVIVLAGAAGWYWLRAPEAGAPLLPTAGQRATAAPAAPTAAASPSPAIAFVGPRGNIPLDAPVAHGFWSFAQPVPGVLSRSGQPLVSEFAWLQAQGWRSVVSLRVDGERGEVGDDAKLPGFSELGLRYLHLPMTDGRPPTDSQAQQFLTYVTDPNNQPVHVHCRGGIGRTGVMVALYRYAIDGWPVEAAVAESRLFLGGVSGAQARWLRAWATTHAPGEW